ncbi:hypothetical protein RRF57_011271 [Xylaria bambusicola]|uniref:Uncharacterized protein n=1 Tax=Xylaria bambusicola TaxID=326684 RepID=A0AAN7UWC2_9PEZI
MISIAVFVEHTAGFLDLWLHCLDRVLTHFCKSVGDCLLELTFLKVRFVKSYGGSRKRPPKSTFCAHYRLIGGGDFENLEEHAAIGPADENSGILLPNIKRYSSIY